MPSSRQLAAIMFTDIVGYTTLMGDDEQKAFELLAENRKLQKPLIEQFGGTWIKELGDGVLVTFSTVTDAVLCACCIIKGCRSIDGLHLRIGIHQAEVVFENGDVFGDGVNIAARLQSIAPIGGICITETVQNNVANRKEIRTSFIKEEVLKHVKEPVRIYEVIIDLSEAPSTPTTSFYKSYAAPILENGIAVLPFVNMSSDPEQEFFSDGLTEEIITDLSRLKKLLVISRSSIMTYKGTAKKIKAIATDLNVRYILEGSVRKSGNNLRITAQLIDALNDVHIWAEKYNGTIDDIFDIQEKVSRSIVDALDIKISGEEDKHLSQHPIQNVKAYEYYIRARQEMWKITEQGLDNAIALAQRGLDLIGENALLYAIQSSAYLYFHHFGIRPEPTYIEKASQLAAKSLALDSLCSQGHFVQGAIEFVKGHLQEAAHIFKRVLSIDQNNADGVFWLTACYFLCGRPDAAVPTSQKLLQVDPISTMSHALPGVIEFHYGHIKESLPYYEQWLQADPYSPFTRFWCATAFAINDKKEDSIKILDAIINDTPALTFAKFALFFKSALQGDKEGALKYATDELKNAAKTFDYFPLDMAYGFALINEKEETLFWLNKMFDFGNSPYPLLVKLEVFHTLLKDNAGFQSFMQEVKNRSEQFVI